MLSKEEAKEKLGNIVEKFLATPKNKLDFMPEEDIKFQFIEPLLEALGWEKENISKETRVLKGRADYILKLGNQESLVIEAKKTNVSLSEDEGRQAVSYAYHRKVKFAILTNFKYIRVYHALSNIKNIDKNLLFWFEIKDFEKEFEKLWLLSRESIEKGELNKKIPAKDERQAKPVDISILQDLLEIRGMLSRDLKKLRTYLDDEKIDEAIQILIDRLIFMRAVEDRGLENKNFLLGIIKDFREGRLRRRLWVVLQEEFKRFDKDYNSKLFAPSILENEKDIFFDDDTLAKVIRVLYFGYKDLENSRYMFDEIPGDLLGSIYEQYLGVVLRGTEKRVKLDLESGKRKKMGIYYTPSYIVDYIVKNTVGEYIKNKTIDEIIDVKIVDPACGSGSFLIRAFQEVCDMIEQKLKKGEKSDKYSSFKTYKEKLSLGQKSTIMTNCIYGVDLDEKAVELAQLNLLLKMLEFEERNIPTKRLPNLLKNIKNGNSLIDDYKVAGDKAFNWHAQFPDVFKDGGFDVVIGNPPYGAGLKENERKWLENKFKLKSTDTAVLFMGLAVNLAKNNGVNSYIIPKPFVYSSTWEEIRENLLNGLREIVDCGKVWKEVKLEQVVYFYDKDEKHSHYNSCIREETNIKCLGKINKYNFKEFGFLLNGISEEELKIGKKIRNVGSFMNDYIFNQRGAIYQKYVLSNPKNKSDYKVLGGKQINKYYVRPDVKGFINKGKIKDDKAFIKGNSILTQRIVAHVENPKDHIIITASLSKTINYKDYVIVDTINQLTNKSTVSSEFLLAILNSKLISWYAYRFIFGKAIRTMQFDNPVTNRIPIPNKIDKSQEKHLVSIVEQMLSLQKKLRESGVSGNEKERLEQQIKNIDYEIDQEVYRLYGLTKEEIKVVDESLG